MTSMRIACAALPAIVVGGSAASAQAPPNDTCDGAIELTGSGGSLAETLEGAGKETSGGCGSGADVFYRVVLDRPSLVYLDTFTLDVTAGLGANDDTAISYRGTSCPGSNLGCADNLASPCASPHGLKSQLVKGVAAGTHYFAVHAVGAGAAFPFDLHYQIVPQGNAGYDINRVGPGVRTFNGSTSVACVSDSQCRCGPCEAGFCNGSCAHATDGDPPAPAYGTDLAPEFTYFITQCPGDRGRLVATTCNTATGFDTALYVLGRGASPAPRQYGKNDDLCPIPLDPTIHASTVSSDVLEGAGMWVLYVDGNGAATPNAGPYRLSVIYE